MEAPAITKPLTRGDLESMKSAMLGELQGLGKLMADRLLSHLERADEARNLSAAAAANLRRATPRSSISDVASAARRLDLGICSSCCSSSSSDTAGLAPTAGRLLLLPASSISTTTTAISPFPAHQQPHHHHRQVSYDEPPLLTCEGLEALMAQRLATDPHLLPRWAEELERRLTAQTPTPGSTPRHSTGPPSSAHTTPLSSCPTSPLLAAPPLPPAPFGSRSRFCSDGGATSPLPPARHFHHHHHHSHPSLADGSGNGDRILAGRMPLPKPSSGGGCGEADAAHGPCITSVSTSAHGRVFRAQTDPGLISEVGPVAQSAGWPAAQGRGGSAAAVTATAAAADRSAVEHLASAAAGTAGAATSMAADCSVGVRRELPQQLVQEIVRQLAAGQQRSDRGRSGGGAAHAAAEGAARGKLPQPSGVARGKLPQPSGVAPPSAANAGANVAYRPSFLPDRQARQRTPPPPPPPPPQHQQQTPPPPQQQEQPHQQPERRQPQWQPPQWSPDGSPSGTRGGSIYSVGGSGRGGPVTAIATMPTAATRNVPGAAASVISSTLYGCDLDLGASRRTAAASFSTSCGSSVASPSDSPRGGAAAASGSGSSSASVSYRTSSSSSPPPPPHPATTSTTITTAAAAASPACWGAGGAATKGAAGKEPRVDAPMWRGA